LYRRRISQFVTISTTWSYARRDQLSNNSDYKLIDRSHIESYTTNTPVKMELENASFPDHDAFIGSVKIEARPWLKRKIYNGQKDMIQNSSPLLRLEYRKGVRNVMDSDVDYDQIEAGFRHDFSLGVRVRVIVALKAGVFLSNESMFFPDYKHLLGN